MDVSADVALMKGLVATATERAENASISAGVAQTARDLAQKWANYMDGTVDETEYSAKWYATKAADSETVASTASASATAAADSASASATGAHQSMQTAQQTAAGASASAQAAEGSAVRAEDAAKRAEDAASRNVNALTYDAQTPTPEQQARARANIGILSDAEIDGLFADQS